MICYPTPKINIGLNVLRKREDGFHDLDTLFYPVDSMRDTLSIEPAEEFSIEIEGADWDPQKDLTAKAWQEMRKEFGDRVGAVAIRMKKGIPTGAGLGGGSADCAWTIRTIDEIFGLGLSKEKMEEIAGRLGSDCAFFIKNMPQWGEGRGEILHPAPEMAKKLRGYSIRIALPAGVHVSTAEAYGGIRPHEPETKLRDALKLPVEEWKDAVRNDFEDSIFPNHQEIAELKAKMYRDGAVYASMTGSGAAVYGIFRKTRPRVAQLPEGEEIDAADVLRQYRDGEVDLICVLGPTASGKTHYAVRLARELTALSGMKCEIISADSRQVYRGMDIGTGKDLAEYGEVPYHLIDILPAGESYNVYRFQQDFSAAYQDILGRGAIPILCGGTGLYISAVTGGYDWSGTSPLSAQKPQRGAPGLPKSTYFIGTLVDRETRNAKIDARLEARMEEGMVEEIAGLLEQGMPAETLIAYGLEYKFVTRYLLGEMSREEMISGLATAIHQFAKRQMTWWRGMERSGIRIHWTKV